MGSFACDRFLLAVRWHLFPDFGDGVFLLPDCGTSSVLLGEDDVAETERGTFADQGKCVPNRVGDDGGVDAK